MTQEHRPRFTEVKLLKDDRQLIILLASGYESREIEERTGMGTLAQSYHRKKIAEAFGEGSLILGISRAIAHYIPQRTFTPSLDDIPREPSEPFTDEEYEALRLTLKWMRREVKLSRQQLPQSALFRVSGKLVGKRNIYVAIGWLAREMLEPAE